MIEHEVVGCDLRRHWQARPLGRADQLDGSGRRCVLHVVATTRQLNQLQVTSDDDLFARRREPCDAESGRDGTLVHVSVSAQARILCMLGHQAAELSDVLHRPPEQTGVGDCVAVIGEEPNPGGPQIVEVCEVGPLLAQADRTARNHANWLAPGDLPGEVAGVDHRVGVRHGNDRSESAGDRCGHARLDVLLPFLAWLAQVGVQVEEAGPHPGIGRIDDLVSVRVDAGLDAGDRPVDELDVDVFDSGVRDHRPTGDEILHSGTSDVSRRNSTAIRTAMPLLT